MIQERLKVIDKVGEVELDYDFCYSEPSKTSEVFMAIASEEERKQILRRTVPRLVQLEQQGYQVRPANYGYKNKRVRTDSGKRAIQVKNGSE